MAKANHSSGFRKLPSAEVVERRLGRAAYTLLSIHQLAKDALQLDKPEFYLVAIADLARTAFKGIDASLEKLTGEPAIGNFRTEFDVD